MKVDECLSRVSNELAEEITLDRATVFFQTQESRLQIIERSLLSRVEEILPGDHAVLTATELLHLCARLNKMHLHLLHRHQERTESTLDFPRDKKYHPACSSYTPSWNNSLHSGPNEENTASHRNNKADTTDERISESKILLEKCTGKVNSLSQANGVQGSRHMSATPRCMEAMTACSRSVSETSDLVEAWRARQSLMTDSRLRHSIEDDIQDSPGRNPSQSSVYGTQLTVDEISSACKHQGKNLKSLDSDFSRYSECEDSFLDSLAPTVKGYGFFQRQALEELQLNFNLEKRNAVKQAQPDGFFSLRAPPSEIVVKGVNSNLPSHDTTTDKSLATEAGNKSPNRSRIVDVGDESLLVTPVLARYRLEPDDSSVGVRVVPNRPVDSQSIKNGAFERAQNLAGSQKYGTLHPPSSFQLLRRQVRNTRRTMQSVNEQSLDCIEETLSPNVSVRTPTRVRSLDFEESILAATSKDRCRTIKESLSDFSFDTTRHEESQQDKGIFCNQGRRGIFHLRGSMEKTTYAYDSRGRIIPDFLVEEDVKDRHQRRMAVVSRTEYDNAPSVVRSQVSLAEVNRSIEALNLWFTVPSDSLRPGLRLNDAVAAEILQVSQQESKILMMSLCHWRRMNMFMDDETECMYFLPNERSTL